MVDRRLAGKKGALFKRKCPANDVALPIIYISDTTELSFHKSLNMYLVRYRYFTLIPFLIATLIFMEFASTAAGGSCQSYGHSCLGGHGKRKDVAFLFLQKAGKGTEQNKNEKILRKDLRSYDIIKTLLENSIEWN